MKIKTLCAHVLAVSATTLYSASVLAQEAEIEEPSTFSYTPLVGLLLVMLLFRKKLIAEATPEHHGEVEHHHAPEPVAAPEPAAAKPVVAEKAPAPASAEKGLIDVSVDANQCQGTTAKGARCSRTANLETIELTVNGKDYRFSTCKQHNNDTFKPFWSCLTGGKGGN